MNPINDLKAEHQAVKLTLKILNKINQKIQANSKVVNPEHVEQLLEFFSIFVDTCHHGKEEELLFPALEQIGVSRDNGPIGVMLHEHRLGRTYVYGMKAAWSAYRKGDGKALKMFIQNANCYITLLSEHIHKEDAVLFPLAENNLPPEKQTEIYAGFEKIEIDKIGIGKHEEFHRLLEQLQEIYLEEVDEDESESSQAACRLA